MRRGENILRKTETIIEKNNNNWINISNVDSKKTSIL
jgi:hypothetical protein